MRSTEADVMTPEKVFGASKDETRTFIAIKWPQVFKQFLRDN